MRRRFIPLALLAVAAALLWLLPREQREWTPRQQVEAARPRPTWWSSFPGTPAFAARETGNVAFRVVTPEGQPLEGAIVRVYRRGRLDPAVARYRWTALPTPRTNRDGIARTDLQPGEYFAAAHAPGRAPAWKGFTSLSGTTEVQLTAALPVTLRGRVEDAATREPIALADLKLNPSVMSAADPPEDEQPRATSGPDGRFTVELAAGPYVIEARASGYGRSTTPELDVPGETVVRLRAAAFVEGRVELPDGTAAALATITASQDGDPATGLTDTAGAFSVQIEPGALILSARSGDLTAREPRPLSARAGTTLNVGTLRLEQGGAIDLQADDQQGAPVAFAEVLISPFGWNGATATAQTGQDGRALIKGIPEGSYDLDILAQGYARYLQRGLVVSRGTTAPQKATLLGQGEVEGVVRDGAGAPVEGAFVKGQPLRNGFGSAAPVTARTEAGGHYRLTGLDQGTVQIAALAAAENVAGDSRSVEVPAGGVARMDLVLEATGTIAGHVALVEKGLHAAVRAQAARGSHAAMDHADSQVDADGRYSLKVPAGQWLVHPYHPMRNGERRPAAKSVEVKAGQTVELDLAFDDGDAITGQVLEPDGSPASRASLLLHTGGHYRDWLTSDEDGRFRLTRIKDLPEGTQLIARKHGRSADVPLAKGEMTVRLHAPGQLVVSVASNAQPVEAFTLLVDPLDVPQPWQPSAYQVSGSTLMLDDVPIGRLRLTCTLADGVQSQQAITLDEDQVLAVRFDLSATARIHGQLVDRGNAPVAGAAVQAYPGGEGAGILAKTDSSGRFSISLGTRGLTVVAASVPPGRVTRHVQVESDDVDLGVLKLEDEPATQ